MSDRDYLRVDYGGREFRPSFWSTYPCTKASIITLAAIHVLHLIVRAISTEAGFWIDDHFWLWPERVLDQFFVWQLATMALFHASGVWHLGMNCLMLFYFGRMVEERLAPKQFWVFCLCANMVAALAFLLESVVLDQTNPGLGASGIVLGLVVLAAMWFPHREILFFFVLRMPLWVLAVIVVVADVIALLELDGGIAHSAHLGGALFAFLYVKYGGRFSRAFEKIDELADKRERKKQAKTTAKEADLRREVDRILDKVNQQGMAALTDEERRFLKDASGKLGK